MQSTRLPSARMLSPISVGLIIAGGLFFVITVVVRHTIMADSASTINQATEQGQAVIQAPLQNNIADALPAFSLQPTATSEASSLPTMRAPVYFMDATATPFVLPTPVPPTPAILPAPVQSSAYQAVGSHEQRAVLTPAGWELCARFGVDIYGTPLYFGNNDAVAQWFVGLDMEHRLRVIEACGGQP